MIEWGFVVILYLGFGTAFMRYAESKATYKFVFGYGWLLLPIIWLPVLLWALVEVYYEAAVRR